MNRILYFLAACSGAALPFFFDSAWKGAALLGVALLAALALRRASAAARHLVWLVALACLLLLPLLSVCLPQWRVLPAMMRPAAKATAPMEIPVRDVTPGPVPDPQPSAFAPTLHGSSGPSASVSSRSEPPAVVPAAPASPSLTWWKWLPAVWLVGFILCGARLFAAHLFLRRAAARGIAVEDGPLRVALDQARTQLGIRRPVRLLVDQRRTIPVVWGVFRPRLLLPEEARTWDNEQLRSVLLHELAHVKRHDALGQWLAQAACALHWFNPLAWFAAWRLHVERERACDDLVLASGVRASTYATHLLHVATTLSTGRWPATGGLAMARKSRLEGRLLAILSERLNRRGLTAALATAILLLGAGLALPIAMLRAAEEKPEPPHAASVVTNDPAMKPKHEYAQSLFRKWQARARTDGKIPGALIGHVARELENFIGQKPDSDEAKRLAEMRSRIDASRDWTPAEVVALLDDVTAIATAPVSWADLPMEFDDFRTVKSGQPLPAELAGAAWGQPEANGLRAAWLLEPRAEQYPLGTVLKAHVLFHNSGDTPILFRTETWHQSDTHTARDAEGTAINVSGTFYTGITPMAVYRLLPDEYCEVTGHGIAIGAGEYTEERSLGRVGAIIEAKEGDHVSLSHTVDAAQGINFSRPGDPEDPVELWKKQAAERVASEAPLPQSAADREQLIRRVTLDLTGVPPTPEEIARFVNDATPAALDALAARLAAGPPAEPWTGKLATGVTTFRVTAADPDAAKAPRGANSPGRYVLGDNVHLQVSQITSDSSQPIEKIDWAKTFRQIGASDYNAGEPFDVEELARLANEIMSSADTPGTSRRDKVRRLSWLICRAGAENETLFRYLLNDEALKLNDDDHRSLALALAGYDYSVNDNQEALKYILDDLAKAEPGSDAQAAVPLGFIDEWEVTIAAHEKHFAWTDGAGGIAEGLFWLRRQCLFPEHFSAFSHRRLEAAGLDAGSLRGRWQGEKDGVSVELRFEEGKDREAHWQVRKGDLVIDAALRTKILIGGPLVILQRPRESSGTVPCGQLKPGSDGTLQLDIWQDVSETRPGYPRVTGIVLTKQADATIQFPKASSMLASEVEAHLQWGAAVNGLRMALARPQAVGEAETREVFDLRLVVQNVSEAPVRIVTSPAEVRLLLKLGGRILSAFTDSKMERVDYSLQPREVGELRLFSQQIEGHSITADDPAMTFAAELTIGDAAPGWWSGTLASADTAATASAHGLMPRHKDAQALFTTWSGAARRDGEIPGALVGLLADSVRTFIEYNPKWETTRQLEAMLPRFDATRDWSGLDAIVLLDELAALQGAPLLMALDREHSEIIRTGAPLPPEFADAPWGATDASRLRAAYLLEPRRTEHPLNTPLKGRLLIHNAGKTHVVFRTRPWHHLGHTAKDATGADVKVDSTSWITLRRLTPYRLAPGEFVELSTTGIGVGANRDAEDWQNTRVGSWLDVTQDDDVTVATADVPLSDWNEDGGEPRWWLAHIKARLARHAPLPADAEARQVVLYRVAMELFGNPVNDSVNAAFIADDTSRSLDSLAERLSKPEGAVPFTVTPFVGALPFAPTKFRVLPPDPDAAKRPRTASNPGRYTLGDLVRFEVTQRRDGKRLVNEATLIYFPPGQDNLWTKIPLPDGYDSWAAAWVPGQTDMWITQVGLLRKFDFTDPANVQETRYEGAMAAEAPVPADVRDALRAAIAKSSI